MNEVVSELRSLNALKLAGCVVAQSTAALRVAVDQEFSDPTQKQDAGHFFAKLMEKLPPSVISVAEFHLVNFMGQCNVCKAETRFQDVCK